MIISEVSEKYGLTHDTLRYYERIGLIPPVKRRPNGIREYDGYSCGWIEFIYCMRKAGLPIETLVEYVQLYQQGAATKEARKGLLLGEYRRLDERTLELQTVKERLLYKINNYDQIEESVEIMDKDNQE